MERCLCNLLGAKICLSGECESNVLIFFSMPVSHFLLHPQKSPSLLLLLPSTTTWGLVSKRGAQGRAEGERTSVEAPSGHSVLSERVQKCCIDLAGLVPELSRLVLNCPLVWRTLSLSLVECSYIAWVDDDTRCCALGTTTRFCRWLSFSSCLTLGQQSTNLVLASVFALSYLSTYCPDLDLVLVAQASFSLTCWSGFVMWWFLLVLQ